MARGETHYSLKIKGSRSNWNWPVIFDITDGIVGIDQKHEDGTIERVLLSKGQVNQLLSFIRRRRKAR